MRLEKCRMQSNPHARWANVYDDTVIMIYASHEYDDVM